MITYVRVRNLAIVEEVSLEPEPGLNVLTGETGAGKSLLIDSLQFLSGARGSAELIRSGADKMTAEAVFHLPRGTLRRLEEAGVESNGDELIVKRELSTAGRGRVLLNGSIASVRELSAALERILEIHGQDESRDRIAGANFREVLDLYGGNEDRLETTWQRYKEWREAASQLQELERAEKDRLHRADLLRYQIEEIGKAALLPDEEEALRSERSILANARQISEATTAAIQLLSEDDEAALSRMARALQFLQPLTRSIEELRAVHTEMEEIRIRLEESVRDLSRFADSRHDPARLESIEERLATIERLEKKYGGTIPEVLDYFSRICSERDQLQDYEASMAKLQRAESERQSAYRQAAQSLSQERSKQAPLLEKAIERELGDLAMERTRLVISISEAADGPEGFDRVEFRIAPNAGEEPRPLNRIASGGELSRIQLGIAAALFKQFEGPAESATLVFDEIDSGIGGRVAEVVGRKLRQLAEKNQVICVTHLPQIASFATTQFRVWKDDQGGRTRARIEKLADRQQRVREIARMLAGETIPASALEHARELLEAGEAVSTRRKRASAPAV